MLENTRKYFSEDLKRVEKLKLETQDFVAQLEKRVNEGDAILNAYYNMKNAKERMIASPILIGTTGVSSFVLSTVMSPLVILIPSAFIIVLFTIGFFKNYSKYKSNKTLVDKSAHFTPNDYKTEIYDDSHNVLMIKAEYLLSQNKASLKSLKWEIENYQKYIYALNDILQSEDIVEKIKYYYYNFYIEYIEGAIEEALLTEWEAYLDEVSKIYPEDVKYISTKELLKIEPVKLNLTSKCAK